MIIGDLHVHEMLLLAEVEPGGHAVHSKPPMACLEVLCGQEVQAGITSRLPVVSSFALRAIHLASTWQRRKTIQVTRQAIKFPLRNSR
jgi:hypothetical protein